MSLGNSNQADRVPVTILTGFLGAGKTTLLNRILKEQHGQRIAVIENEYGEIGVDSELVLDADEEIFEMNNGCICCTVRGDLIRIIGQLMKRKESFDSILIETTGLADPAPVIQTFFMDEDIQAQTRLDGVITLVDAKHVMQHWDSSPEVKEQVAFADVILLNKIDLATSDDLDQIESRIHSLNASVKLYRTKNAEIDLKKLLDIKAFDLDRAVEIDPHFLHDHHHHDHVSDIGSVGIEIKGELDPELINSWISQLLAERGEQIFRMKGILAIHGMPRQVVFQGVHMIFNSTEAEAWGQRERTNRIVFIGRNLDRDALNEGFMSCLVS